jgi:hypothetical protein
MVKPLMVKTFDGKTFNANMVVVVVDTNGDISIVGASMP